MAESIRFAGDVNIEDISIVTSKGLSQNVTNQVMAIEIYEDLYSPFTTGVLNIRDSFDFTNLFPFVGEEYVNIKIHTPSFTADQAFDHQYYIFKVSDRQIMGDRSVVYQVHFISREAIVDINKNISKSYSGNIGSIAKDIITNTNEGLESKKNATIEPTGNNTKFISNFWSPVRCLNYAAGNAANSEGACNYTFFENRKGLNFVSLDYLYKQQITQKFVFDNYSRDIQADNRSIINVEKDYQRILDLEVPVVYDYMDRVRSGMFASKLISHDITTKRYVSKNFDMLQDFLKNTHLNDFAPISKSNISNPNAMVINYPKYYGVFNGFTDVSNAKTLQKRISRLQQADVTKLNVNVFGRTDYTVGMVVNVKLNRMEPIGYSDSDIEDKVLSGNYIISAINHYINREKHECAMELTKDSFIIDLNEGRK